jgi:hypothetical protein
LTRNAFAGREGYARVVPPSDRPERLRVELQCLAQMASSAAISAFSMIGIRVTRAPYEVGLERAGPFPVGHSLVGDSPTFNPTITGAVQRSRVRVVVELVVSG